MNKFIVALGLLLVLSSANAFENAPLTTPPSLIPQAESDSNVRALIEDLTLKGYDVAVTHYKSTDAVSVRLAGKSTQALRDVCFAARKHNVALLATEVVVGTASAMPYRSPYDACSPTSSYDWKGLEK